MATKPQYPGNLLARAMQRAPVQMRAPVRGRGAPAPPLTSIRKQIQGQESRLLRQGQAGEQRYSQIRMRHIWSTFYFTSGFSGSIITAAGVLQQGEYSFFTALSNQNGQGLPTGFFLSDNDTDFPGANRVSDDQNFSIWEMGLTVQPMRADLAAAVPASMTIGTPHPLDVDQICDNGIVSIKYLTNDIPMGAVGDFVQSGGPSMTAPTLLDYSARASTEAAGAGPAGNIGGLQEGGVAAGAQVAPWGQRQAIASANSGNLPPAPGARRRMEIPIYLPNTSTFSFKVTFARPITLLTPARGGTGGFRLRLDWWAVESFREQG